MSLNEVGIRLRLETGEAVASANQAERAIDSLGSALQKAAIAGDDKGVISYANALKKYKKYAGVPDEDEEPAKPTALKIVENATKIIGRAPSCIGAMGSGNAAGAALGMASDAAVGAKALGVGAGLGAGAMTVLGVGAAVIGLGYAANKLSEQWEKMAPQSMRLTAVLGGLTSDYKTNSDAFLRNFNMAGQAASKFGYALEEGMSTAEELAKRGAKGLDVYGSESRVFQYERGTGADRALLIQAEGFAKRYGLGNNTLGYALGGTKAQGLETAQFQEYLNASLRIFEEGLSRGVIKGFGEITRTQNFIALLGNGSPLWKGEQGLQRYQAMNQAFTSTSFQSEYDVIRYQATRAVMDEAAKRGFKDDKDGAWSAYKKYGNPQTDGYLSVQRAREGGITPEIFTETMKLLKSQVAGGSYSNLTEAVVKSFNVNYTAAADIIKAYGAGAYKSAITTIQAPDSAASPEMKLQTTLEDIKRELANAGASVLPGKAEVMSVLNGILVGIVGNKMAKRFQEATMPALGRVYGSVIPNSGDILAKSQASKLLGEALKDITSGPDKNNNQIGDNADAAMGIIGFFENLPEDMRKYIDSSGILNGLWNGKKVSDLPSIADFLTSGKYMTPEKKTEFEQFGKMATPRFTDIDNFFGRVREWNPQWGKQYGALGQYQMAAGNQVPGTGDIFREFSLRLNQIDQIWSTRKSKDIEAAKDPKSPGGINITPEEQKTIDSYNDSGKKRQVDTFLSSSLGAFNELIQDAMEKGTPGKDNGKEITPEEWGSILLQLRKTLSDFSANLGTAADKMVSAAGQMSEGTEIVMPGLVPYSTRAGSPS
ncbi:MAG: hypothetical protein SAMD01599839_07790 [Rectinema sp.]